MDKEAELKFIVTVFYLAVLVGIVLATWFYVINLNVPVYTKDLNFAFWAVVSTVILVAGAILVDVIVWKR
tara:strand:- start:814 stop:1023 length:210 start_codon:yes stop_codon:yes gene_type:complete